MLATEIKELLGKMEHVTVRVIGERVYIEGYADTLDESDRLKAVVTQFPEARDLTLSQLCPFPIRLCTSANAAKTMKNEAESPVHATDAPPLAK